MKLVSQKLLFHKTITIHTHTHVVTQCTKWRKSQKKTQRQDTTRGQSQGGFSLHTSLYVRQREMYLAVVYQD